MFRFLLSTIFLLSTLCLWGVNEVELTSPDKEQVVLTGQSFSLKFWVRNNSATPIDNLGYSYEFQGKESSEYLFNLSTPLSPGEGTHIDFKIYAFKHSGSGTLTLRIKSLNKVSIRGRDNQPTALAPLTVLSRRARRKVVVEDFTGTWCGYCPMGIGAMEILGRDFKDRVIPMAIHSSYGDVMDIGAYDAVIGKYVSGFPRIFVNRIKESYPRLGNDYKQGEPYGLLYDIEEAEHTPAVAEVSLSKAQLDPTGQRVIIESRTTFGINREDSPYRLAYALMADGLRGNSYTWQQTNYYAGKTEVAHIIPNFVSGGRRMAITFDHTVVRATHPLEGISGSLPSNLQEGVAYAHEHQFDISNTHSFTHRNETLIQDKNRLTAVVLLIDTRTDEIVNAASLPVSPATAATIEVEVGEQGMATIATPHALTLPQGLEAFALTMGSNRKLQLHSIATAGQHLPAQVGVIIQASHPNDTKQISLEAAPTNAPTVTLPTGHLLRPALHNGEIAHSGEKLYILSEDPQKGLGFYWQVGTQGNRLQGIAGRAYLALPSEQAYTQGYSLSEIATGLTLPYPSPQNDSPLFDLSGRRVEQPKSGAVYLRQGQKMIQ